MSRSHGGGHGHEPLRALRAEDRVAELDDLRVWAPELEDGRAASDALDPAGANGDGLRPRAAGIQGDDRTPEQDRVRSGRSAAQAGRGRRRFFFDGLPASRW